jgi:hypothetical protein
MQSENHNQDNVNTNSLSYLNSYSKYTSCSDLTPSNRVSYRIVSYRIVSSHQIVYRIFNCLPIDRKISTPSLPLTTPISHLFYWIFFNHLLLFGFLNINNTIQYNTIKYNTINKNNNTIRYNTILRYNAIIVIISRIKETKNGYYRR